LRQLDVDNDGSSRPPTFCTTLSEAFYIRTGKTILTCQNGKAGSGRIQKPTRYHPDPNWPSQLIAFGVESLENAATLGLAILAK